MRAPAYLARLRALLPPAVAQSREGMLSPVSSSPVSLRHARTAELESELPRRTRCARRRMRPVRVMGESVGDLPILTIQDPLDVQDSSVDEEVKLLPNRKGANEPDPLGAEMCRSHRTLSGKNSCLRRSLFMGLGRNGIGRGYLQWYPSRLGLWTQKPQGV